MSHEITNNPLPGVEAHPGSGHYGVFDHGAQVWAWQPDGQRPVLWMSSHSLFQEGKAIRGGVPVIFPWFGGGPDGNLAPAHGFLRTIDWNRTWVQDTIESDGRLVVEYEIGNDRTGKQPDFPYAYAAYLRVTFTPEYLQVGLRIINADDEPFTFESALHTYLAVGDVRQVRVEGLEGSEYLDRATRALSRGGVQDGPVTFTRETDRLYDYHDAVVVRDNAWKRRLRVSKEGSNNLVVWNPWVEKSAAMGDFGDHEWPDMLCIEAANAAAGAVRLEPGQAHLMRQRVTVL